MSESRYHAGFDDRATTTDSTAPGHICDTDCWESVSDGTIWHSMDDENWDYDSREWITETKEDERGRA